MNNESLHDYFERSYTTGTDIWTHIPTDRELLKVFHKNISTKDNLILDIGCGRGLLCFELAKKGQRVIGIDIIKSLIIKNNEEVKNHRLVGSCGFIYGSGLDIPFIPHSFDIIIDSGFMHHLYLQEFNIYKNEILRVLKPGGYLFQISYSQKTSMLLGMKPSNENRILDKYGLHYHFFDKKELEDIFLKNFNLEFFTEELFDSRSDPGEELTYNICVWKRK